MTMTRLDEEIDNFYASLGSKWVVTVAQYDKITHAVGPFDSPEDAKIWADGITLASQDSVVTVLPLITP